MIKHYVNVGLRAFLTTLLMVGAFSFTGCDRKEKVLDVDTPNRSLEIKRSDKTGNVDIEIKDKD